MNLRFRQSMFALIPAVLISTTACQSGEPPAFPEERAKTDKAAPDGKPKDEAKKDTPKKEEVKADPADYCVRWGNNKKSGVLLSHLLQQLRKDDTSVEGLILRQSQFVRPSQAAELISPDDVDFDTYIKLDYGLEPFFPEMRQMSWEGRVLLVARFLVITEASKKGCLMTKEPYDTLSAVFAVAHPKELKVVTSKIITDAYKAGDLKKARAAFEEVWSDRKGTLLPKSKFESGKDLPEGWVKLIE